MTRMVPDWMLVWLFRFDGLDNEPATNACGGAKVSRFFPVGFGPSEVVVASDRTASDVSARHWKELPPSFK